MCTNYDEGLNLPKTQFPMRGNLPKREPEFFKQNEKNKIYEKLMNKNKDKDLYVLHDGPPYANGDIHLGTALNKILKDFIIKYKNMNGFKAPFIPGWDTHGLPIELKALKSTKKDRSTLTPLELRKMCKDYALKYIKIQKEQFKSLGVIGDFSNAYLTFNKDFEAEQIKVFGKMLEKGYIYKGLKPVYWCCKCGTALAESEIEYENDECTSLYVSFKVNDDGGFFERLGIDKENVFFVIWTTTAWTLPANVAICLSERFEYSIVRVEDKYYVLAKDLVENCMLEANVENYDIVKSFSGSKFKDMTVYHPFIRRNSLIIVGDHVTLDAGTGCVHTAPGHGLEDFEVCKNYKQIPIKVVVDEKGLLNKESVMFEGIHALKADSKIIEKLKEVGSLFATKDISHKYPHCWRCKQPVLFRATEQWFCSVEDFKEQALDEVKKVKWIPKWGENRISNMIQSRSDWCISRQRVWGVPIPILYCKECKNYVVSKDLNKNIANMFKAYGSDCWFEKDAKDFLPENFVCLKCQGKDFEKEKDIMDVWFDSGCSHVAVLENSSELSWPADLYLEGADQYRGWFQSSFLTAVAYKGASPYRSVCTHGWVVDGDGRKMSKSLANGVKPEKIISQYGADILRLWVAFSDYHSDIRISDNIIKQLTESYRKIRNTARFILGNIFDFKPDEDFVEFDEVDEIDKWALVKLDEFIKFAKKAYDEFKFFNLFHELHNFCVIYMSNFYLDVIKDRLYCEAKNSQKRRAAQTAIYVILDVITRIMAPILAFTSDEIWQFMPHKKGDCLESVLLNDMYEEVKITYDEKFQYKWNRIFEIRNLVKKALEEKRKEKIIGSSLESKVVLYCKDEIFEFLKTIKDLLKTIFIVSDVEILKYGDGEFEFEDFGVNIDVEKPDGKKCERCWSYSSFVGKDKKHVNLCERCSKVVNDA